MTTFKDNGEALPNKTEILKELWKKLKDTRDDKLAFNYIAKCHKLMDEIEAEKHPRKPAAKRKLPVTKQTQPVDTDKPQVTLIPLLQLDEQGVAFDLIFLNPAEIIGLKQETRYDETGPFACCRIVTTRLCVYHPVDGCGNAVSYNDSVLVAGTSAHVYNWMRDPRKAFLDNYPGAEDNKDGRVPPGATTIEV